MQTVPQIDRVFNFKWLWIQLRKEIPIWGFVLILLACNRFHSLKPQHKGEAPDNRTIVNGEVTSSYPEVGAVIIYFPTTNEEAFQCTGTLLNPRMVLTAAHCLYHNKELLPAARILFSQATPWKGGITAKVDEYQIHPDYNISNDDGRTSGDVAILKLDRDLNLEKYPLLLGDPSILYHNPLVPGPIFVSNQMTAVGYGYSNNDPSSAGTKRVGTLKFDSYAEPTSGRHVGRGFLYMVRDPIKNQISCSGDSGGPLYAQLGSTTVLAGISKSGENTDCNNVSYAYYTSIAPYLSWIYGLGGVHNDGGFIGDGFYTNYLADGAKWLGGAKISTRSGGSNINNDGYYYMLPDGFLYAWNGKINAGTRLAKVPQSYRQDPFLFLESAASYAPPITALPWVSTDPRELDALYELATYTDNFFPNFRGFGEKYLRGKTLSASNGGWYFILPSGSVYSWGGTFTNSVKIGSVPVTHYQNPFLLTEAAVIDGLSSDPVMLSKQYDLKVPDYFPPNKPYYENYRNFGEKYLQGKTLSASNSGWYFILPHGTLYSWNESFTKSVAIGKVDPAFYENPILLTEQKLVAQLPTDPIQLDGDYRFTLTNESSYPDPFYTNYWGYGSKVIRGKVTDATNGGWYFIFPHGTVYEFRGSMSASRPIGKVSPSHYERPYDLLEALERPQLTTDAVKLDQTYAFSGTSNYDNYRKHGEKYVVGKVQSASNGGWYFILPHGTVYQWNGSLEISVPIGYVNQLYHQDTSKLVKAYQ